MTPLIFAFALAAPLAVAPPQPDRLAAFVQASAPLPGLPGATGELMIAGAAAAVRVRRPGAEDLIYQIRRVEDALSLLADRRVEPLWPAILAWTGPTMERLRDRRLAAARAEVAGGRTMVATSTAASSTRPPVRAAMLLADELWRAGRPAEAMATLEAARGRAPGKGAWAVSEWTMLSLRLASLRQLAGDAAGALAAMSRDEAALGKGSDYAGNFRVNRAAYLAEAGRHAEALALVEAVRAAYQAAEDQPIGAGGEKVPGSDRHFQWIRACALKGLGRETEGAAAAAAIFAAEQPTDEYLVVDSNALIRYRLAHCTGDAAMSAREFAADARRLPIGGSPFLLLQPALRLGGFDPALRRRILEHPALAAELRGRFRELPPELVPALNYWHPPKTGTP